MVPKARYVELPLYVVHIGLLYALLLTSGLVLAWVTIYRHEKNIAELRQMLKTQEDKHQSQAVDIEPVYTTASSRHDMLLQEDENGVRYQQKNFTLSITVCPCTLLLATVDMHAHITHIDKISSLKGMNTHYISRRHDQIVRSRDFLSPKARQYCMVVKLVSFWLYRNMKK